MQAGTGLRGIGAGRRGAGVALIFIAIIIAVSAAVRWPGLTQGPATSTTVYVCVIGPL